VPSGPASSASGATATRAVVRAPGAVIVTTTGGATTADRFSTARKSSRGRHDCVVAPSSTGSCGSRLTVNDPPGLAGCNSGQVPPTRGTGTPRGRSGWARG
jgi:hypothetical protein